MEESVDQSRTDTLKSNQPASVDAEVQTENGMRREGKFFRGRGRGHWRGGGRSGRPFKRRARGGVIFLLRNMWIWNRWPKDLKILLTISLIHTYVFTDVTVTLTCFTSRHL